MAKNMSDILDNYQPNKRLKQIIDHSNLVEVDFNVPPKRYYRSGLEMVRMANVYYKEGNLENAYYLYLKFMTLFLEKIRKHPEFNTVPLPQKSSIHDVVKDVLPKAEKIKEKLLEIYRKEYDSYSASLKLCENEAEERRKKAELKKKEDSSVKPRGPSPEFVTAKIPSSIDNVNYPDANLTVALVTPTPSAPAIESAYPILPSFDRTKKPLGTFGYNNEDLKKVIVPSKIMSLFESLAQENTNKNIETCGILAGKLEKNQLIITHMIVPKQTGTSNSCTTTNEEEIFDFQDQYNLITIGWIHTHPTQTAFLSSVDLHTHCPYQLLMPEAIAIVCSPKFNNTGFFNLTPNYGLQYIANCRESGFHPHTTDPPLFKNASHVSIENTPLDVLDLRK
ncbi:STAM-binding protein-like [Euwallacea fornicatus]|uniref:STAM-binding protein-like n=1 Tax=Euwallacea fornicatus TaxID=995702 RepID=UPI00338E04E7